MSTKAQVEKEKSFLYPRQGTNAEQDLYLVVEVHGVGHVVAELGGVEAVMAGPMRTEY